MRKVAALSFILLLLLTLPVGVSAEGTTIQDSQVEVVYSIPSSHTITVVATSHVDVLYEGSEVSSVVVTRHSQPSFTFRVQEGYALSSVKLGDQELLGQVKDGKLTLPKIWRDEVLTVETKTETPTGSHRVDMEGTLLDSSGKPIAGAQVQLLPGAGADYTDASGRFRLRHVPPGVYTLQISKDGVTVQLPLILRESASFTYTLLDGGGYMLNVPLGFESIDLTLTWQTDGSLTLSRLTGQEYNRGNPITGDLILLSVITMVLSGLGLAALLLWWKRRPALPDEPAEQEDE